MIRKKDMSDFIDPAIGKVIRQERKARGWSQARLAEKTGLTRSDVSRIERGGEKKSRVQKLLEALDIGCVWAMDGLDCILIREFRGLTKDDKISILGQIVTYRNPPEKAEEIFGSMLDKLL